MKTTFFIALLSVLGIVSGSFFLRAIYDIANYYFYFSPNKVAAEYEATMLFVGAYFVIALLSAALFMVAWRQFKKGKPALTVKDLLPP